MCYSNVYTIFMLTENRVYESGEYSDFKIKCHGDVYLVHKAIVCPRYSFFEAASRLMKVWKSVM
jgi:hypothetical protein